MQDPNLAAVSDVAIAPNGKIWASLYNIGIAIMDIDSGTGRYVTTSLNNDERITFAVFDQSNNLWISYTPAIYAVFDTSGNNITASFPSTNLKGGALSLRIDPQNRPWFATMGGIAYLRNDTLEDTLPRWRHILPGEEIHDVAFTPPTVYNPVQVTWVASYGKGLKLIDDTGTVILTFTAENSALISDKVNGLYFDSATSELWISTDEGVSVLMTDLFPPRSDFNDYTLRKKSSGSRSFYEFNSIPDKCDIRIYTVDGFLVKQINAVSQQKVRWYLDNYKNAQLRPGVYFYTLKGENSGIYKGKLIVK